MGSAMFWALRESWPRRVESRRMQLPSRREPEAVVDTRSGSIVGDFDHV
jgi:hypothetical protein